MGKYVDAAVTTVKKDVTVAGDIIYIFQGSLYIGFDE